MLVHIHQLKVICIIGCLPEERLQPQELLFDIYYSAHPPKKDHVGEVVDYTQVAECVRKVAEQGQFQLLEVLVDHVTDALLEEFVAMNTVSVKAIKSRAILSATFCAVKDDKERKDD
ncbi:MAG TPA: dihydroneopterin aldolase [Chlamydiales bacterium]|nr:dihydroneopterin aldolase [Chlamydiales bacterium]